ncbi:MAG: Na/Pi cotransporter family protein [bacterium]|nr:Na/Pi cotransporter family protein [bacterium]
MRLGVHVVILVFTLAGGLGLFLYGMQLMGEGLQKAAGDRLRRLLEILTSTPVRGVIVGTIVTVLIQSSSATTVMVVGFVNAGLLNLSQAAGIILGSNIGTTITAQMVSLKLTDLALPAIAVGFLMSTLARSRNTRHIGQVILGFGILFLGMKIMSDSMKPLRSNDLFNHYIVLFGATPILGVLVGALFTAVIQSSSAFTGLVVILAIDGVIGLDASIALVLGSNIGTCITAYIASFGTSITAKRAAIAHVVFKIFGVLVVLPFRTVFTTLVLASASTLPHQVANAHTLFNVINVLLILPFLKYFIDFVTFLVPGKMDEQALGAKFLDEHLLETPSIALGQATKELLRMGDIVLAMMDDVFDGFKTGNVEALRNSRQKEAIINSLEQDIITYLVKVSQKSLSDEQSIRLTALLNISNDIERVGDHADNIQELAEYKIDNKLPFSSEAMAELEDMNQKVRGLLADALKALEFDDIGLAKQVIIREDGIDQIEKDLRRSHIFRLNEGKCNAVSGIVFLDVISNLERMADHANNIAEVVA